MEDLKANYIDSSLEVLTPLDSKEDCHTFLVKQKTSGRIAVKKQIPPSLFPLYEQLSECRHPNLASVFEVYRLGNRCFVLEEYVSGSSVDLLLKKKCFSEAEVDFYISQLCDVLLYLHSRNIIHRDINPGNIIISSDNVLKLIDFDIARTKKPDCPKDTTILGTVGYAAPEQFGFGQSDERTDIYSLGVLINVMLTGVLPGETLPSSYRYRQIVKQCTRIDPSDRFDSASHLRMALADKTLSFPGKPYPSRCNDVPSKGLLRHIPGFRTGSPVKAGISILGYMAMLLVTAATVTVDLEQKYTYWHVVTFLLFFIYLPWAVLVNIGYYDRKFPVFQNASASQKWGIKACMILASLLFGFLAFLF